MQVLHLDLGERSYPIYIGTGLIAGSESFTRHIAGARVAIVTNDTVARLYLAKIRNLFAAWHPLEIVFADGEQYKTLDTLNRVFDELLNARCDRHTTIVALGGGVVGDMAGLAAALYQRGVPFIQIPTTLLAQVDSSVGGKTAVNHPRGKNMIGAFYQPQAVIIDVDFLDTLPDRELSAGLAEVIKIGLVRDPVFFAWLETHIDKLRARDKPALAEAIERSCRNKAEVVAADERESGVRATLNLGHTFGHAIETTIGYGKWLHGEAVGAGMALAAELSHRLDWISDSEVKRVKALLQRAGLPTKPPPSITPNQFIELMSVDKKALAGKLRLVLLQGIGKAVVTDTFPLFALQQTLETARQA